MSGIRETKKGLTYREAGVDIDAGNALVNAIKPLAARTNRSGVMSGLGGFGGLFDIKAAGFKDPILVAANDGVGTKVKLAIEQGIHQTIGIDLVAMCVNDLVVQGAEPLFFLDYFATGKLDTRVAENVIEGIAEGCALAGCALIGGETAEMPGMYGDGDYDLAGFSVGAVERGQSLPRDDIAIGDVVLGLTSSGAHSNGYSLIRKLVERGSYCWQDKLSAAIPELSLGAAFLAPTKIYVKPILSVIKETGCVKALAHITGGGLTENIPRILPDNLSVEIDLSVINSKNGQIPGRTSAIFHWLQNEAHISEDEMLRTFNCGIGMVLIVSRDQKMDVMTKFEEAGEKAVELGQVTVRKEMVPVRYLGKLEL